MSEEVEQFVLEEDEELQFNITTLSANDKECIVLELTHGTAEIFGFELQKEQKYNFYNGTKFSVFTFHGCTIQVKGNCTPIRSKDHPMIMYLQIHASLEKIRKLADESSASKKPEEQWSNGPITMIVGPTDVGKSTLCRLLLNYGVRMGRRPVFVDLDVGQGSISLPGTIAGTIVDQPVKAEELFDQSAPLVFSFGYKSPGHNIPYYNHLVKQTADTIKSQMKNNRKAESSGVIINTCGWIKGLGYDVIKHAAQAFEVDMIIVLDEDRLYRDLVQDMPHFVKVVWLPKSTGVIARPTEERIGTRLQKIREYFYGALNNLEPYNIEMKFEDIQDKMYAVENVNQDFKLVKTLPNPKSLKSHILALSFAKNPDELTQTNIAGFVCVTESNSEIMTLLSPQPNLPDCLFLVTDITMHF